MAQRKTAQVDWDKIGFPRRRDFSLQIYYMQKIKE